MGSQRAGHELVTEQQAATSYHFLLDVRGSGNLHQCLWTHMELKDGLERLPKL